MIRKVLAFVSLLGLILPGAALAAFTENSPEFKAAAGQLSMDGHSEHDITTCKVRKAYNSEILEMLNEGMPPDEIVRHYTDELGPGALKVPDTKGTGLAAWTIPIVGAVAGAAVAAIAIRKISLARKQEPRPVPEQTELSAYEKLFDAERKKNF